MGRKQRALPWDVRIETLNHPRSMPSQKHFWGWWDPPPTQPLYPATASLRFPFAGTFLQQSPGHYGLWEEWYSAFVRKASDFPGGLCVPSSFTNWQSGATEHFHLHSRYMSASTFSSSSCPFFLLQHFSYEVGQQFQLTKWGKTKFF